MPARAKNGLPWSEEDLQQLRQMATSGSSADEIASRLERTKIGVKSKSLALGIPLKTVRRAARRLKSSKSGNAQRAAQADKSNR